MSGFQILHRAVWLGPNHIRTVFAQVSRMGPEVHRLGLAVIVGEGHYPVWIGVAVLSRVFSLFGHHYRWDPVGLQPLDEAGAATVHANPYAGLEGCRQRWGEHERWTAAEEKG